MLKTKKADEYPSNNYERVTSIFYQRTDYHVPHCSWFVFTRKNAENSRLLIRPLNHLSDFGLFSASANRNNLRNYLFSEKIAS
ncbi:MAG: hypothetical protein MRERV_1c137 [Mycoplasmataceae bacterium RV_VA103A]|nr:MAG: hypothetical protein MRERV_1c137 [Mycoplasmataceae bacterium RV_VA103A]